MHWVVQDNIYSLLNLELLLDALKRADIEHTVVTIPRGSTAIDPDVDPDGSVFVCGALKMAAVAQAKGWSPGSLLNDNFHFEIWQRHLGGELLNSSARVATLRDLALETNEFVRPAEDNKAFTGRVFNAAHFQEWKDENPGLLELEVIASAVKKIYREYRLFFVNEIFVTGSLYMQAGEPVVSSDVDLEAIDYARTVMSEWSPAHAFVVDVALTEHGYKIIEFNNINSSGFYASDVNRLVAALHTAFD